MYLITNVCHAVSWGLHLTFGAAPITIYSTIEVLRQYITVTELALLCRKYLFELTGTDPGRAPYQALSEV